MPLTRRIMLLLAVASGLSSAPASADEAVSLKLSWDHCAADGQVGDRSFACNTNSGSAPMYGSMVINDGNDRQQVNSISAYVDFRFTSAALPPWWQTLVGQCRTGGIGVNYGPFPEGGSCAPWFDMSGDVSFIGTFLIHPASQGPASMRLDLGVALPVDYHNVTLYAGQEHLLFQLFLTHAKSTGAGACAGCTVPTCIGFGQLGIQYAIPNEEKHLGSPASAVTWQGAYVNGYEPVSDYYDGVFHPYAGNLSCSTGPVPGQARTWGLIKTLYR